MSSLGSPPQSLHGSQYGSITTVGYGDTIPVTVEGKFGVMILMVLGIGLFSAVTASITSYFMSQDRIADNPNPLIDHLQALTELRREGSLTEEEFSQAKASLLQQRRN